MRICNNDNKAIDEGFNADGSIRMNPVIVERWIDIEGGKVTFAGRDLLKKIHEGYNNVQKIFQ